ncbi:MAG: hypothetical protein HQL81_14465 [Magnetococcales bacterium]|nr:hypothetical protein [Magnetococcales bacterium]
MNAKSAIQPTEETIDIPVENMGTGIFNMLGDMIGGLVDLHQVAHAKLREGVAVLQDRLKGKEAPDDDMIEPLPIDPTLKSMPHPARTPSEMPIDHP